MSDSTKATSQSRSIEEEGQGLFEDEDVLVGVDDDESMESEESSVAEISLGKDETRVVKKFRILLLILLIGTAVGVSLTALVLAKMGEYGDFEDAVDSHARKIIETFEAEASEKRTALIQLSRELTSHAKFANMTWPFVHLPDWELRAMLTRELADVIGIMVLPIVEKHQLYEWGNYTVANQNWYWEGMEIQEMYFGVNATTRSGVEHFDGGSLEVHGHVIQFQEEGPDVDLVPIDPNDPGPFFPVWQYSPQVPVPVINTDFHTMPDCRDELNSYLAKDARMNLVGPIWDFETGSGGAVFVDMLLERYSGEGSTGGKQMFNHREPKKPIHNNDNNDHDSHYQGGPLSYYYIPIYEEFGPRSKLVGVIMSFVFWQTYFENLLPEDAVGIHVVLENTCGQTYTFGISGPTATFLGEGDLHNHKYNDCVGVHETDFGVFLQRTPERAIDDGGCLYKLHVYPTQEMEDKYMTNKPLTICLAILGVFVFTTVTFCLYDQFVERRQRIVLKSAQESGNVVSKLFPEEVRDRLYNETNNKSHHHQEHHHNNNTNPTTGRGKGQFLQSVVTPNKRRSSLDSPDGSLGSDPLNGASPIADEYPNCTVFFADLAGFTSWSSTRTPSEVFLLLETIYGAFDKIAKRLGVFKIETIGDCYVAVTGLPKPQQDHAIIMCKFAASCIFKFNQLVHGEDIMLTLGDDTANLQMRVGMHSGPVTAGVLRGAKARFQLFGDTVNVASRMESNGQKGKIQVSQSTADVLVAAGKDKWLSPREDLVEAKGKGQMQTYWVDVGSDPSMRSSVTSSRTSGTSSGESCSRIIAYDQQQQQQEQHDAVDDGGQSRMNHPQVINDNQLGQQQRRQQQPQVIYENLVDV